MGINGLAFIVVQSLGEMLLETYIKKHFIYVDTTSYDFNALTYEQIKEPIHMSKDGIYEFYPRNATHLQMIIKSLENDSDVYLPKPGYFVESDHPSIPGENIYSQIKLEPDLRNVVLYTLSQYCGSIDKRIVIPSEKALESFRKDYLKYTADLGAVVISSLIKIGFFTESEVSKEKGKTSYRLLLEQKYAAKLLISSSFYRAPISQNKFPTAFVLKRGQNNIKP